MLRVLRYMEVGEKKTIVCVSNLLTWDLTPKRVIGYNDLKSRQSSYHYLKELEDLCLDI